MPILSVSNYRCFGASAPARLNIEHGVIAIVGQNNAGKSALMKLFTELRPVLSALTTLRPDSAYSGVQKLRLEAVTVFDPLEVFCNTGSGELVLEIECPPLEVDVPVFFRAMANVSEPSEWTLCVHTGDPEQPILENISTPEGLQFLERNPDRAVRYPEAAMQLFKEVAVESMYVGPQRPLVPDATKDHYGLKIGSSAIETWNRLKTGQQKRDSVIARNIQESLKSAFGFKDLEISAADGRADLQITIEGHAYRLKELGSGFAQFFVTLVNIATQKSKYLFFDEPETGLHARLQIALVEMIASYFPVGVCIATHSLALARSVADRIYVVHPHSDGARLIPFGAEVPLSTLAGELGYSAMSEIGAEQLLLVEGATDVKIAHVLLRRLRKDSKVLVLPLSGDAFINPRRADELEELKRLNKPIAVLIDSERSAPGAPISEERRRFVELCSKLEMRCHVLERRATENYLPDAAIQTTFGRNRRGLGPYESLKSHPQAWPKRDSWLAFERIQMEDIRGTDLLDFLESL